MKPTFLVTILHQVLEVQLSKDFDKSSIASLDV